VIEVPGWFGTALDGSTRQALLHFRDSWLKDLVGATIVLLIGISFEGPEVVHEVRSVFCGTRSGRPRWMIVMASIGWLLVVAGVGAELVLEQFVHQAEGQVQSFDDIQLSATERQAAIADARAADASNQARNALGRAVDASDRAAAATLEAESEAKKRIRIEQQLAWRTLTPEQENKLSRSVPVEFRSTKLQVENIALDAEGQDYATNIARCLAKAGWSVVGMPTPVLSSNVPEGIVIQIKDPTSETGGKPAGFLQRTLAEAGITAAAERVDNLGPDVVVLFVGIKPRPPQK